MPMLHCATCKAPVSVVGGVPAAHRCGKAGAYARPIERPAKPRALAGVASEESLYAALEESGYGEFRPGCRSAYEPEWVRQYPFGAFLSPPRLFRFDAAFPAKMVGIDVDGGAHAAGRAKVKSDTLRRGLAGAAGWKIVALTPEQVHNGEAVALVRSALGGSP